MRNMSFSITTRQMYMHKKTVTRRLGWDFLQPGDVVMAVEKAQGLKKGEHVIPIGEIKIVSIRSEPVSNITIDDVQREGFTEMNVPEFVHMFCRANKCEPSTLINRIEFEVLY